ncbi:MAG: hypothetical protein K5660_04285 [Paludibacteraceae bacterium]|nr:hypothetical protein [Paludibacteraceae bacterium]
METFLLILSFAFLGAAFYFFYKLIKKNDSVGKNLLFALVFLVLGGICVRSAIDIDENRKNSYYSGGYDNDDNNSNGYNVDFRAGNKGHCYECGLTHYGTYKCEHFNPKDGDPSMCKCKHSITEHAPKK